eukprot:364756-Chlamydomonas_euryale.AAC.3
MARVLGPSSGVLTKSHTILASGALGSKSRVLERAQRLSLRAPPRIVPASPRPFRGDTTIYCNVFPQPAGAPEPIAEGHLRNPSCCHGRISSSWSCPKPVYKRTQSSMAAICLVFRQGRVGSA